MTLNISQGIFPGLSKSYAYDNTNYIQADPINFSLTAAGSSKATFTAFIKKQIKSVTLVATTAPTANDQLTLTLTSLAAQAFGTATGGSYYGSGTYVVGGTSTVTGGTSTATGSNTVTIGPLTSFGTAPAYNPCYMPIAGGTYTVVVANGVGTNTQTGYVFPQGPLGGLTMNYGDILVVAKGTDTVGVYQCELEITFTPGSNLTL
jgi:hypothetical protein